MDLVEKGDTDFIGDSTKIVSLGLDEVNDNPDELVEMRGEGRYFGEVDAQSSMICRNCHQRGHKRAECKTVVCSACGMLDDHYSNQCPKSMVCTNCGEKGHLIGHCTQRLRRIYCQTCSSSKHTANQCPSIWRSYITKDDNKRLGLPTNIYCYNCAEKGHYGDECPERRTSRVPNLDGSAFSGHNLPKQLRDKYFNLHQKRRRRGGDDYYYDDDDYDNYDTRSEYGTSYSSNQRKSEVKPKNKLVDKIKSVFSSKKKNSNNKPNETQEQPAKKKAKKNDKNYNTFNYNQQQIRKTQSTPAFTGPNKSGVLPPKGPASYDFPRNSNYNNNNNYNNSYNNNSYNNNYNSRSGYLEPRNIKPSRSGSVNSNSQRKRKRF